MGLTFCDILVTTCGPHLEGEVHALMASVVTCLPYEILLPCSVALHPAMWSFMALAHAFERSMSFPAYGGKPAGCGGLVHLRYVTRRGGAHHEQIQQSYNAGWGVVQKRPELALLPRAIVRLSCELERELK